jgi:hypothetical protein
MSLTAKVRSSSTASVGACRGQLASRRKRSSAAAHLLLPGVATRSACELVGHRCPAREVARSSCLLRPCAGGLPTGAPPGERTKIFKKISTKHYKILSTFHKMLVKTFWKNAGSNILSE